MSEWTHMSRFDQTADPIAKAVLIRMGARACMVPLSLRGSPFRGSDGMVTSSSLCLSVPSSTRSASLWETLTIEAKKGGRQPTKTEKAKVRERRMRKKLNGTTEKPRLAVFRSNDHLYAQVIDDTKKQILVASSTLSREIRESIDGTADPTMDTAKKVGETIGKLCIEKGISKVAFDRQDYFYKGRIKAFADAAREVGLEF
ncbi:uncharacterized protein [Physcomitrium patens]|uniref:Large ribosomal subunit protein uL18c n=2 Tax=Physcomitrium patens TaxID=3218 RepID=A0A7I4BNW9_PHYPA|nr:uncharacterized protein LOC112282710 isoform X1 [Physcomitrium patens]|eukprot:XP_024376468.1 uncharacterized protein LOC112282710 isoform X1 [Physcomitrella patens]